MIRYRATATFGDRKYSNTLSQKRERERGVQHQPGHHINVDIEDLYCTIVITYTTFLDYVLENDIHEILQRFTWKYELSARLFGLIVP